MESYRIKGTVVILGMVMAVVGSPAFGQVPTFTGLGQLPSGTGSRAYEVSADGTMIVGQAVNSSGDTEAVIYDLSAGSPALIPLGYLDPWVPYSVGRGVGINSTGTVYVSGTSKNDIGDYQAIVWSGTRAGVGSMSAIPFLSGGLESSGERLHVALSDEVIVTGKSITYGTTYGMAFRYKVILDDLDPCGYIVDEYSGERSSGYDVGYREGTSYPIYIVGWGDGVWGGTTGGTRPQAFKWHYYDGNYGCWPQRGLDLVVNADWFQFSAGPNGIAETTANGDNIQVNASGTTGLLEPDAIVVTGGPNHFLKDELSRGGDDIIWPISRQSDADLAYAQSFNYAISSNCRYQVGRSTYPNYDYYDNDDYGRPCTRCLRGSPRQAFLRDVQNREEGDDDPQSGGKAFHWPLGFLEGDNASSAHGVSNGQGYDKTASRDGLVVVGWSQLELPRITADSDGDADTTAAGDDIQVVPVGTTGLGAYDSVVEPGPNKFLDTDAAEGDRYHSYVPEGHEKRAFVCFIEGGLDRAFLKHLGAGSDPGASAASQFKDMKDLKAWLVSKEINMDGWELREALGVSDDGTVIVGWGVHNSVEEGFVVTVEPSLPTGACCRAEQSYPGECDDGLTQAECPEPDVWREGEACGETPCCPKPWADIDGDDDVDQKDFGLWQVCFSGSGNAYDAGCECYDRDDTTGAQGGDGDIDTTDFGHFENCFSGPTVQTLPGGCIQ